MTFGERTEQLIHDVGAIEPLDDALLRIAEALDPSDTDDGAERIRREIRQRFRASVADLAVRNGWRLP